MPVPWPWTGWWTRADATATSGDFVRQACRLTSSCGRIYGCSTNRLNIGRWRTDMADVATTFQAFGDPTRRAIVDRLVGGDATVNELARQFPISLQAVSKHIKVLEAAGVVSR